MSAGCAVGMDSFIPTSVNMFPELAMEILEASARDDGSKAREKQEELSKAVVAISKYGSLLISFHAFGLPHRLLLFKNM